jgi:hypothetical protein
VPGPASDEGVATVTGPDGPRLVYAGSADLTAKRVEAGWVHVGDPDGWAGWLVTPFQGPTAASPKMYEVTAPNGMVTDAVHPLDPGEKFNNSFAAVSPDGRWTVSGEWGIETRFLVFPTPVLNHTYVVGSPLPVATTIRLEPPLAYVQGCAFATDTDLLCDENVGRLVQVRLASPLAAGSVDVGRVTEVGPLSLNGSCHGTYEPEGVDVDRAAGILRVEVNQPGVCALFTVVYEYHL